MTDKKDTAEILARAVDKGSRASFLNESVTGVVDDLRESCKLAFSVAPVDDLEGFRLLRLYLQLLDDFEGRVRAAIANGEKAEIDLAAIRKQLN